MDLWLTLRFRGAPLGLRERFPPGLAFLGRQLRSLDGPEVPPSERISTAYVQVTPDQAEDILAWGRMRSVDGRTLLASATFEERWRAHELAPGAVVELTRATTVDAPAVLARGRSHLARWACSHCDRVRWEQVGSLELSLDEPGDVELLHRARPELQLTSAGELVVSSRLRPVFEGIGLRTRPVLGSRAWLQVEVEASVALAALPPLEAHGPVCRGCRCEPLVRADGPTISNGVCVLRARPWTLGTSVPPGVALAWSEQRLDFRGAVHDGPVHAMGLPLDLDLHPGLFAAQGTPVLLASAALARALADAQAGGLEARPVLGPAHGTAQRSPHAAA
ncbi:MAG TPA: hypothetical protein VFD38_17955 [Myxococcaceae bacterium]|nr:hypothetical protein [Myxococcaceae bacterium]